MSVAFEHVPHYAPRVLLGNPFFDDDDDRPLLVETLPPGWTPDPTLEREIPAALYPQTWKRVPEHPTRYAVDVTGRGGVYDLKAGKTAPSRVVGKSGRVEVYLRDRADAGRVVCYQLARLICRAAYGPAPTKLHQAAHLDDDPSFNHWSNLDWQTPSQNQGSVAKQNRARLRGQKNPNSKLSYADLGCLLEMVWRYGRPVSRVAKAYHLSERYTRDLVKGRARGEDVREFAKYMLYDVDLGMFISPARPARTPMPDWLEHIYEHGLNSGRRKRRKPV